VIEAIYGNDRYRGVDGITRCPCSCGATILTLQPHLDPLDRLSSQEGRHILDQGYEETLRLLPPLMAKAIKRKAKPISPLGRFHCEPIDAPMDSASSIRSKPM
jgi:hypothetical protein